MAPEISVVIPTYNCARYLAQAIESIRAQTRAARDIIVVDDGSTDDTWSVIRPFASEVTYLRQRNAGVSNARNCGLKLVPSDWVLFLDADDYLAPTALEALASGVTSRTGVVYGDKHTVTDEGELIARVENRDCTGTAPAAARASFDGAAFEPGAAMVSTALVRSLGGFNQRYCPSDDRHLWIRCGMTTEFAHVPHVVHNYRIRPGSLSRHRVHQVTASVRVRLDMVALLNEHHIPLFEPMPDPVALLEADLSAVYWNREWEVVDALLGMADEYGLDSEQIDSIRWRHHLPGWLGHVKDQFDKWRAS